MTDAMVRYIGGGTFYYGVPARDMTLAEWNGLPPDVRAAVVAAGLYEPPKMKQKRRKQAKRGE